MKTIYFTFSLAFVSYSTAYSVNIGPSDNISGHRQNLLDLDGRDEFRSTFPLKRRQLPMYRFENYRTHPLRIVPPLFQFHYFMPHPFLPQPYSAHFMSHPFPHLFIPVPVFNNNCMPPSTLPEAGTEKSQPGYEDKEHTYDSSEIETTVDPQDVYKAPPTLPTAGSFGNENSRPANRDDEYEVTVPPPQTTEPYFDIDTRSRF